MGDIVLPPMDSIRASWWSITINNPTEEDRARLREHPSFVKMLKYQDEQGKEGTLHVQGAVQTAQVRASAMKAWLPRAHIEVARDRQALLKYVEKAETAVAGTQVVVKADYLAMDSALVAIAINRPSSTEFRYSHRPKEHEFEIWEYWEAVKRILEEKPKMVGLFTNPQLLRAWIHTRSVWIRQVYLDRQTDKENETKNLIVEYNGSIAPQVPPESGSYEASVPTPSAGGSPAWAGIEDQNAASSQV